MSGQPRWTFCLVTLQRRKKFSAGNQKSDSTNLCESWWTRTWICFRGKRRENISANCREAGRHAAVAARRHIAAAMSLPDCEGAARNKARDSRCQGAIKDSYRSPDSYDVV